MAKKLLFTVILVTLLHTSAFAICGGSFINPITDVCWECVFPISLGSVEIIPYGPPLARNPSACFPSPVCVCPAPPPKFFRIGLTISFHEPARMVEVVKDPYCFPALGSKITIGTMANSGSQNETGIQENGTYFAQAHYYIMPLWYIMDFIIDSQCQDSGGFDLAYMTEVDPLWQDDMLSALIHPESLLFANPIAQFSCGADAIASAAGRPLNPLFWCMGTFGSTYPMTGHQGTDLIVQGSNAAAGKLMYKLSRQMLIWDYNTNVCSPVPTPIWKKFHFRYQMAKPVRETSCHVIGQTGFLWSTAKNLPYGTGPSDNFLYLIFRKRTCCASY